MTRNPSGALHHPIWRFRYPVALLLLVLVGGTVGYMLIEGWDLLDSAFMTVITVSTVGYQTVHPLSLGGKLFSIALILVGVGTMLYSLGLFAELLSGGQLANWRAQRRLDRAASSLVDHFIICGYGRIGTRVLAELERSGVPHIAVDQTPEAVGRLRREGRLFLEGDAASEEVLRRAGVERARGLICAVDSDERAVYITLAARSLNPNLYIIARAGQPESLRRLELAGADRVLSPYRDGRSSDGGDGAAARGRGGHGHAGPGGKRDRRRGDGGASRMASIGVGSSWPRSVRYCP